MAGWVGKLKAVLGFDGSAFTTGMDEAAKKTKGAMAEVKKQVNESNHSLALMGETFGVTVPRHIRTFVSELPGVSSAMSLAFNGLAIIVFVKVLAEATEKVKGLIEAFKESGEASAKIREGFEKINGPLEEDTHQLELTAIKTENAIAKLLGKHEDLLGEALAEATVKADALSKKLIKATEDAIALFKAQDHGVMMQMVTGKSGTSQSQAIEEGYKQKLSQIPHNQGYDAAVKTLEKETWQAYQTQLNENQRLAALLPSSHNGHTYAPNPHRFDDANTALYEGQTKHSLSYEVVDTTDRVEKDAADKKKAEIDKEAKQTALEASKKADEAQWKQFEEASTHWADGHRRSLDEELQYWLLLRNIRAANQTKARDKIGDLEQRSDSETDATIKKAFEERLRAARAEDEANKRAARSMEEYSRAIKDGLKYASEMAEKSLNWAESTGQISTKDAAMARAVMHGQDYLTLLRELNAERAKLLTDMSLTPEERDAKLQQNSNAISRAASSYTAQHREDMNDPNSARSGVHEFWLETIRDGENAAKSIHSVMTQSMQGLNQQIAAMIEGQKTSWSSLFKSIGNMMIQTSLQMGESSLFKSLGGSLHIPGFADGGDPTGLSIVGENGPELRSFPAGTHITNNSDLRSMMKGGGGGLSIGNVDARGSNAAEVEMRVRQGAVAAYQQAMQDSPRAQRERSRRLPSGRN